MSEIQKCPNLVRGGGVHIYKKCPKFKNVPKVGRGGGQPSLGHCPKFSRFFILMPPLICRMSDLVSRFTWF